MPISVISIAMKSILAFCSKQHAQKRRLDFLLQPGIFMFFSFGGKHPNKNTTRRRINTVLKQPKATKELLFAVLNDFN